MKNNIETTYEDYHFVLTCRACPEQYNVYYIPTGKMVAYVRYRGGILSVHPTKIPHQSEEDIDWDEVIFENTNFGDNYDGSFDDDKREEILTDLMHKIDDYMN